LLPPFSRPFHIAAQPAPWIWRSVFACLLTLLTGCADIGYYLQSARGHVSLMQAARPLDDWLTEAQTPPVLKRQLELAQRMRRFAVSELALPDNASYKRYADLKRASVVWNVVAAPALSLTLKTWCFPVAGCVGYRGYFDESEARAMAAELAAQGLEVSVYGVPAYSTLGWMNWAGGDPLLNTFIHYPEGELARLVFHELAHQVVYVKDDTMFNESFATAVERLGGHQWLAHHGSAAAKRQFDATAERRSQFRALTQATRRALAAIYESKNGPNLDDQAKMVLKKAAMEEFRANYARLRHTWLLAASSTGGAAPASPPSLTVYDQWVANANNASLGAQAAYDELLPGFEALFQEAQNKAKTQASGHSPWPAFYDAVRHLAQLPQAERRRALSGQAPSETR
jgi:predicted aminopeptidase